MRTKTYTVRGDAIRTLRLRKMDWLQEELAKAAGISPTQVSRIENGQHQQPHLATVRRLAAALGVKRDELIEWHIG